MKVKERATLERIADEITEMQETLNDIATREEQRADKVNYSRAWVTGAGDLMSSNCLALKEANGMLNKCFHTVQDVVEANGG